MKILKRKKHFLFFVLGYNKKPITGTPQEYQPLIIGVFKNYETAHDGMIKAKEQNLFEFVCVQSVWTDL